MGNLILTEKHEYLLDGVRIPGVTEILKEAGLSDLSMVKPEILERNSAFGKAVHKAIELRHKGTLDEESLDEALKPYLQGWNNFVEEFGYVSKGCEFMTYHSLYRYGLTCDHIGEITKGKYLGNVVGDVKTGLPYPSHKYQLSAYKMGLDKQANTFILYLNPEFHRGYKVIFASNDKREQGIFLSALSLYNVKKQEGLI